MIPRKGVGRQSVKALCLVLLFALLLTPAGCGRRESADPEDFVFGEDFEGFAEGRPPVAIYLQCGAVPAFMEGRESLFPPDGAALVDLIYLAFARFDGEGLSFPAVPEQARELQKQGVSLVLSFSANAADSAARLRGIAADPEQREAFAAALTAGAKERGLDGVDLDWETTREGGGPDRDGMNALMAALRQAGGEDFLITCAVPATRWGLGADRFDPATLAQTVDYFNVMCYDLGRQDRATHASPLWASRADGGWGVSAAGGVSLLLQGGVRPEQILLGCAAYGRAYQTEGEAAPGSPGKAVKLPLPGAYDSGTVQGKGIEALIADPAWIKHTERGARGFVGSYMTRGDLFVTYESDEAFGEKFDFACRAGCGLMLWSLTQDTGDRFFSVLRAKTSA